jgi:hypothetical protein
MVTLWYSCMNHYLVTLWSREKRSRTRGEFRSSLVSMYRQTLIWIYWSRLSGFIELLNGKAAVRRATVDSLRLLLPHNLRCITPCCFRSYSNNCVQPILIFIHVLTYTYFYLGSLHPVACMRSRLRGFRLRNYFLSLCTYNLLNMPKLQRILCQ